MPNFFGSSSNPLDTRPSRITGTMAEWKAWVDGLTRFERDQLFPGMHIDLIPAYEKIMGQEEDYQSGIGSQASLTPSTSTPAISSIPAAKPVSPFGPASSQPSTALKGLLDMEFVGAPTTGRTASATNPINPSAYSRGPTPVTPSPLPTQYPWQTPAAGAAGLHAFNPGSYAPGCPRAFSPASFGLAPGTRATSGPALFAATPPGAAPTGIPHLTSPLGAMRPTITGFGNPATGTPAPQTSAIGSTLASAAAALVPSNTNPAEPGYPSGGMRPLGLLDMDFVSPGFQQARSMGGMGPRLDSGINVPGGGLLPDFGGIIDTIGGLLGRGGRRREKTRAEKIADDVTEDIEHFREATAPAINAARDIKDKAVRIAYEEVYQTFLDFHAFYDSASDEEKTIVNQELESFGISLIPGVSEIALVADSLKDGELDLIETGEIAVAIVLAIFTVFRTLRAAAKFWRWFRKVAKRGARGAAKQAVRAWAKEEVRVIARDAFLALAEEFAAQIVTNGYSYKDWDAADLGISVVSGAVTGAIGQMPNTTVAAWSDITNAMITAFAKQTLPVGGSLEGLVTATERAGWKTILMGLTAGGVLFALKSLGVQRRFHDLIMVSVNVVMDKLWDYWLDLWYSSSE